MAHMLKLPLGKHEALNSNPSTDPKKKYANDMMTQGPFISLFIKV
jgi:hypothetical protein